MAGITPSQTVGPYFHYGLTPRDYDFTEVFNNNLVTPLEDTAAARVASGSDVGFRWVLHRFLDVLPDVDRFGLTDYVAEGFNISGGQLFINLVFLAGYLLPWAILAYYLLRAREIAGPT